MIQGVKGLAGARAPVSHGVIIKGHRVVLLPAQVLHDPAVMWF